MLCDVTHGNTYCPREAVYNHFHRTIMLISSALQCDTNILDYAPSLGKVNP